MRRAHDETATKNFRRFPYLGGRSRLRHDPLFPLHSQETGMENHRGAPAPNPRSGGFPTTVVGPPGKLGSHQFSKLCEGENFPSGRDADPSCARPTTPHNLARRRALVSRVRASERAPALGTRRRHLNAVVIGHAPAPRPTRLNGVDPKTIARIRFLRKLFSGIYSNTYTLLLNRDDVDHSNRPLWVSQKIRDICDSDFGSKIDGFERRREAAIVCRVESLSTLCGRASVK